MSFVGREAASEREKEGDQDERKRDGGENDVRGQKLPVEGPPRAEAVEVGFAVEGEVHQIRARKMVEKKNAVNMAARCCGMRRRG